ALAQAKISYLGEQTKPIPTVIFGLENREIDILQRLSREHPGALYTNDKMPYTKTFTVTEQEFRRMLSAVLPIVSTNRDSVPDYLTFLVLIGQGDTSQTEEFLITRSGSTAFYRALLGALAQDNKPGQVLLEAQCGNVCP